MQFSPMVGDGEKITCDVLAKWKQINLRILVKSWEITLVQEDLLLWLKLIFSSVKSKQTGWWLMNKVVYRCSGPNCQA